MPVQQGHISERAEGFARRLIHKKADETQPQRTPEEGVADVLNVWERMMKAKRATARFRELMEGK